MINGTVSLVSGGSIEITDENVVHNSASISMSTCRNSSFTFGTFNGAVLNIGIIDDHSLDHDFAGASISLSVTAGEEGEEVTTALGTYYVDATKIKRRKQTVMLTAYDRAYAFDTEIADSVKDSTHTPYTAINAACNAVGVSLVSADPQTFPNSGFTFTPSSRSIQTYRDLVMWAVQLMAANAVINRNGALEIRHARYASSESGTSDYMSDGSDRIGIEFSDIRTYIRYLSAYSAGNLKTYISDTVPSDEHARAGAVTLAYNPLLDGKTEEECDEANEAILNDMKLFMQRSIVAKMFDIPVIKLGDLVRFGGGKVDIRRNVIGVPTSIVWKYRGIMTVTCTAPEAVTEEVA